MELISEMYLELGLASFFILGALLLRFSNNISAVAGKPKAHPLEKQIMTDSASGNSTAVVASWEEVFVESSKVAAAPTLSLDAMKVVVQIIAESGISCASIQYANVAQYMGRSRVLSSPASLTTVLEVAAASGKQQHGGSTQILALLHKALSRALLAGRRPGPFEALLTAYSTAGDEANMASTVLEMRKLQMKMTPRCLSIVLKGQLKRQDLESAIATAKEMRKLGYFVPSFAVLQLIDVSCKLGQVAMLLDKVQQDVTIPAQGLTSLLEYAHKTADADLLKRLATLARESDVPLVYASYDALVKGYAAHSDCDSAIQVFKEMQQAGFAPTEGTCTAIISNCAGPQNVRAALEVFAYAKEHKVAGLPAYSALMKVYATGLQYAKACDLYDELIEDGLEPDAVMSGCLMKFAVDCGRVDLSRKLFTEAPNTDMSNYMCIIRACGTEKDSARALQVLDAIRKSEGSVDTAAYNSVLDVCLTAGADDAAKTLFKQIRHDGAEDVVTYNTFLKALSQKGDVAGALSLLREMREVGFMPNDVSYNSILNAMVSTRSRGSELWEVIRMMKESGVSIDHYTFAILLKYVKTLGFNTGSDVQRVLSLLDDSSVDVCADEILLSSTLEVCIKARETQRMKRILAHFKQARMCVSVHTYGTLIKAYGSVLDLSGARALWGEMIEERKLEPTDIVLGCMLDALVKGSCAGEADALLEEWTSKGVVKPNVILFSTLIKGFGQEMQPERAQAVWSKMEMANVTPNVVSHNALIDAYARTGDMETASKLLEKMSAHGLRADRVTYSTIVKGQCQAGKTQEALRVMQRMHGAGLKPDAVMFNALLDACVRTNRLEEGKRLVSDMAAYGVEPSTYTLTAIVKLYGRSRELHKAFDAVYTLSSQWNLSPNAHVRTCLMAASLQNGNLDRAIEVFTTMKLEGFQPDAKAYSTLVTGCARKHKLRYAVGLVEEAFGVCDNLSQTSTPGVTDSALEELLRKLADANLTDELAAPLMQKLYNNRCNVNRRLFALALRGAGN